MQVVIDQKIIIHQVHLLKPLIRIGQILKTIIYGDELYEQNMLDRGLVLADGISLTRMSEILLLIYSLLYALVHIREVTLVLH